MATETARFALELEDGISGSSDSAQEALKSLQAQLDRNTRALVEMQKTMRLMGSSRMMRVDSALRLLLLIFNITAAYRRLTGGIDQAGRANKKFGSSFVQIKQFFANIRQRRTQNLAIRMESRGMQEMASRAKALPSPLARVGKALVAVGTTAAGVLAAAIAVAVVAAAVAVLVALVAALGALAVATGKATAQLLRYAAAQGDAMRSERLRLEGLGTLHRWMRLSSEDAAQMSESINRVSERVPLARSQIAGYGQELHRLGIRGRAAEDALEALSIAQAVQGDLGRRRLMMLVREAGHSEGAMHDLAERVRRELGGVAAAQMRSLSMLSTKLRESLHALFTGINLEPLLSGLHRLTQLLSQNTESGRALRAIMSAILGPLVDELGGTAPAIEYFFKELVILALRLAIVFVRVRNEIQRTFGPRLLGRMLENRQAMDYLRIGLIAVGLVVVGLAAAVFVLTMVVVGLLMPVLVLAWELYLLYQRGQRLVAFLAELYEFYTSVDWSDAGRAMIEGIIQGLDTGVARLRQAVTNVATDAMNAFRAALGIHSPSAVFAGFGLAIPQGVAEGVERGSAESTRAVGSMLSTTTSRVTSIQGGPSRAVSVGELHVHVGAEGEGGEDTARRVTDALREFFDTGLATEPA